MKCFIFYCVIIGYGFGYVVWIVCIVCWVQEFCFDVLIIMVICSFCWLLECYLEKFFIYCLVVFDVGVVQVDSLQMDEKVIL